MNLEQSERTGPAGGTRTMRPEDRFEIQDCLFRYARAVDRLDYEGIRECYFEDAVDNHGGYVGTVDGLVEDIRARHVEIDSSQHFITNILIEPIDDDTAHVESYCLCFQRLVPAPGSTTQSLSTFRTRYVDRFERRAGRWAIAGRVVVFDEGITQDVANVVGPHWVASRRDAADAVYTWFSESR
jgi:3-phenylpropionate/cinnamic acid dioxygenase small subunit